MRFNNARNQGGRSRNSAFMGSLRIWLTGYIGLYTDESPGLKVDPVVVMTLSVVFIFSVVALHGMERPLYITFRPLTYIIVIAKVMRKFSA
jgi:hypothetical protein